MRERSDSPRIPLLVTGHLRTSTGGRDWQLSRGFQHAVKWSGGYLDTYVLRTYTKVAVRRCGLRPTSLRLWLCGGGPFWSARSYPAGGYLVQTRLAPRLPLNSRFSSSFPPPPGRLSYHGFFPHPLSPCPSAGFCLACQRSHPPPRQPASRQNTVLPRWTPPPPTSTPGILGCSSKVCPIEEVSRFVHRVALHASS